MTKKNGIEWGCLLVLIAPPVIFFVLLIIFQEATGLSEAKAFDAFLALISVIIVGYAIYDSVKK